MMKGIPLAPQGVPRGNSLDLLGKMVEDISFNNAKNYFPMELA